MELKWQRHSFVGLEGQDRMARHFCSSDSLWCGAISKNAIFPLPLDRVPSFWDHRWVWVCDEGCQLLLKDSHFIRVGSTVNWHRFHSVLLGLQFMLLCSALLPSTSLYVTFLFQLSTLQTLSSRSGARRQPYWGLNRSHNCVNWNLCIKYTHAHIHTSPDIYICTYLYLSASASLTET